ncbi:MAG TPA: hypothetical protein GYA05_05090 [Acholeplasmataceae bacterium]|jgi:hypothetical protein|nr:hypothetical protein [Acholeplasmataceae bacterium]
MEKIRELLSTVDAFVERFIGPILEKIVQFLSSGENFAIGLISVFVALVLLIGLITWMKKSFKSFLILLIIFGALTAVALLL